jgi:hypothetical protein
VSSVAVLVLLLSSFEQAKNTNALNIKEKASNKFNFFIIKKF